MDVENIIEEGLLGKAKDKFLELKKKEDDILAAKIQADKAKKGGINNTKPIYKNDCGKPAANQGEYDNYKKMFNKTINDVSKIVKSSLGCTLDNSEMYVRKRQYADNIESVFMCKTIVSFRDNYNKLKNKFPDIIEGSDFDDEDAGMIFKAIDEPIFRKIGKLGFDRIGGAYYRSKNFKTLEVELDSESDELSVCIEFAYYKNSIQESFNDFDGYLEEGLFDSIELKIKRRGNKMDFDKIVEERLISMYTMMESSDSIVLEAQKAANKEKGEKARNSFIKYVKKHDPEKGAELEKEPSKVKQAIKSDYALYKKWRDEHAALNEILVLFLFGVPGVGLQEINRRQARKKEAKKGVKEGYDFGISEEEFEDILESMDFELLEEELMESYDEILLEAQKANPDQEKAAKSFLSFLKRKHPEKYEQAKKNPGVLKKFINEYRQWAKDHPNMYSLIYSGISTAQTIKNFAKPTSVKVISSIILMVCEKLLRGDIDLNEEAERVAREKKKAKAAKKKEKEAAKKAKKAVKEAYDYEDAVVFLEEGYEEDEEVDEIEESYDYEDAVVFLEEGYEEETEDEEVESVEESYEDVEESDYLDLTE